MVLNAIHKYVNNFVKVDRSTLTFLGRLLIFFGVWKLFYFIIWSSDANLAAYKLVVVGFIDTIVSLTAWFLDLFDYEYYLSHSERLVRIGNSGGVTVGEPCAGIGITYTFIALLASYPGNLRHKFWFIPLGVLLIYLINVGRVVGLALLSYHRPEYVEFNHKYLFKIIVYLFIFLLFLWWIKFQNKLEQKPNEN